MINGDLTTARVHFFKTLGDRTRMEIIDLLYKYKELTVSQISKKLDKEQNLISHHLSCLRNAGIVKTRKKGKNVICSIKKQTIYKILNFADRHIINVLDSILSCHVFKNND